MPKKRKRGDEEEIEGKQREEEESEGDLECATRVSNSDVDNDTISRCLDENFTKGKKGTVAEMEALYDNAIQVRDDLISYLANKSVTFDHERLRRLLSGDVRVSTRFPELNFAGLKNDCRDYLGGSEEKSTVLEVIPFFLSDLVNPMKSAVDKVALVHRELKLMATFENKTEVLCTSPNSDDDCSEPYYQHMMRGVYIESPDEAQNIANKYLGNITPHATDCHSTQNLSLLRLASFWNDMLVGANLDDDPSSNQIDDTVRHVFDWCSEETSTKKGRTKNRAKTKTCTLPTHSAREKKAVRPIIASLLRALSLIGNGNKEEPTEDGDDITQGQGVAEAAAAAAGHQEGENESQGGNSLAATAEEQPVLVRSDMRKGRYIPKSSRQEGTRRYVDCEINQLMAFNPNLLAHEMPVTIQAKNVVRGGKTAEATHEEAVRQCAGRLARRTVVAFNMGGVGIDLKSIALIITPVYLEVITMILSFATDNVDLEVKRSGILPLVSEAALKKFVPEGNDRAYLEKEAARAFPRDNGCVPVGLREIWKLVCSDDKALGLQFFNGSSSSANATYQAERRPAVAAEAQPAPQPRPLELCKVIGYGTHGIVYDVEGDDDADSASVVVKSSVVGEVLYIERELKALRALNYHQNKHPSIPVLHNFGGTSYKIRGTTVSVPAFMFSPRGVSVDHDVLDHNRESLQALLTDIMSALEFAHEKHVFHLDVCARNIILYHQGPSCCRYVLIDWACSVCGDAQKATGFRGSLAFAHQAVHEKKNGTVWSPEPEHDKASLLFTVCALHKGVPIPWAGFYERGPDPACLDDRREQTTESLKVLQLDYQGCGSAEFLEKAFEILENA